MRSALHLSKAEVSPRVSAKNHRQTRGGGAAWPYFMPAVVVFTIIVVVPILWTLVVSLFKWNGIGGMKFAGLANFQHMISDPVFRQAFVNNLIFTLLGTCAQMFGGLVMSLLLICIEHFRNFMRTVYFVPCVISSVAISQIFSQLLAVSPPGVFNSIIQAFGGQPHAFLSDPKLALVLVTLIDAYKFAGIYMVIYYAALQSVDQEVLEAALIDGCNWWQQLIYIRIPLIRAVVEVSMVMLVSGCLKGFDVSYVLTAGGPGSSSELVSTYLYKTIFLSGNFGYGSAISVFLAVECLVAIWILRKLFGKDE
ncbi:sugar ABC transporter permease [Bifidobacterium sp. ESL0769]|uniref:carbohydrate ABC transporter permease n=1 Tax=Bifidobacterium sp. ESL0769 TaxID=2983229 RepID=UPI0023F7534C|nr:sugar ABC transporter permease [Bifidobacterium sp. ESL0769]WEV67038.1 sugar ABC transporter permease [Bifidobacterium sp. ESL0769]